MRKTRRAGDWLVHAGVTIVDPKANNHPVLGVDSSVSLTYALTYIFTGNFGVELLTALPFEHDLRLNAGGSKVGSTKQLPPVLSAQWHFNPIRRFQPYVGLGINHTQFFDESTTGALAGSKVALDLSWGLAAQAGFDFQIGQYWSLNPDARYIDIDSNAKLDGASLGTVEVDPWVYQVNIGWIF